MCRGVGDSISHTKKLLNMIEYMKICDSEIFTCTLSGYWETLCFSNSAWDLWSYLAVCNKWVCDSVWCCNIVLAQRLARLDKVPSWPELSGREVVVVVMVEGYVNIWVVSNVNSRIGLKQECAWHTCKPLLNHMNTLFSKFTIWDALLRLPWVIVTLFPISLRRRKMTPWGR